MPVGVYIRTAKHRENLRKSHLGHKHSEETKRKMSLSLKGYHPVNEFKKGHPLTSTAFKKGHKMSAETKRKIGIQVSLALKGKYVLDKHPNWRGGKSFEPYTTDWTETLRKSIRERDRYTCQACGIEPAIEVHHIDYNKVNCNPDNLVTLCKSCHCKTGYNRKRWIKYFTTNPLKLKTK